MRPANRFELQLQNLWDRKRSLLDDSSFSKQRWPQRRFTCILASCLLEPGQSSKHANRMRLRSIRRRSASLVPRLPILFQSPRKLFILSCLPCKLGTKNGGEAQRAEE